MHMQYFVKMLQSTSLLRGKTMSSIIFAKPDNASIHFPLAREDWNAVPRATGRCASIHFPLAREDITYQTENGRRYVLQSTSLLRGKTMWGEVTHAPYGASIHFPLAREDDWPGFGNDEYAPLQSTSLLRGKTFFGAGLLFQHICFNPLPSCEGRP